MQVSAFLAIFKHSLANASSNTAVGFPPVPFAGRAAPTPRGHLPPLPSIFTASATASDLALRLENEWLDPQLLGHSSAQETVTAVDHHPATSIGLGVREMDDSTVDSRHEDDAEEEIGPWSM